jgi:hypothetical protein
MPVIPVLREVIDRRAVIHASLRKTDEILLKKLLTSKKGWRCGSRGKCLPSKHEVLDSSLIISHAKSLAQ